MAVDYFQNLFRFINTIVYFPQNIFCYFYPLDFMQPVQLRSGGFGAEGFEMQLGRHPLPAGIVQDNGRNHNVFITAFSFQQIKSQLSGYLSVNIIVAGIQKRFCTSPDFLKNRFHLAAFLRCARILAIMAPIPMGSISDALKFFNVSTKARAGGERG